MMRRNEYLFTIAQEINLLGKDDSDLNDLT
jgi:hypothetical protein